MENSKKNQEMELRELNQEELVTVNGGAIYKLIIVDGQGIIVKVDNE